MVWHPLPLNRTDPDMLVRISDNKSDRPCSCCQVPYTCLLLVACSISSRVSSKKLNNMLLNSLAALNCSSIQYSVKACMACMGLSVIPKYFFKQAMLSTNAVLQQAPTDLMDLSSLKCHWIDGFSKTCPRMPMNAKQQRVYILGSQNISVGPWKHTMGCQVLGCAEISTQLHPKMATSLWAPFFCMEE